MKYVNPTCVLKWKTFHVNFDMSEEELTDVFETLYLFTRGEIAFNMLEITRSHEQPKSRYLDQC